jgi:glycosyltransferase involved in cell wall biosynthesis
MRIALLTTDNRAHHRRYDLTTPYFGPAIEALLQGLREETECEIHVISCSQKPMSSPDKLGENVWFHLLHVPKIGWLRTGYQGCIRAVRKKVRELQPDLVHGQGTERDCAISAIFSGFPNIVTIHGNMRSIANITHAPPFSYNWCAARIERYTLPRTGGVVCNSRFTEDVVHSLARRTWPVPNAVRREFFQPFPEGRSTSAKPILLNVGTIAKHKRQIELLEVAEQLHREGHAFDLQFIGAASPRDSYAAEFLSRIDSVSSKGFARHVEIKSASDLITTLDSASALIHIPSAEAFGLVVAEALARNLKFFGTNIGGIPDIAAGIEGAEIFPLEDRQGLVRAMGNWITNGCISPQTAAKTICARYHPEIIASRHMEVYRDVIKTGSEHHDRD